MTTQNRDFDAVYSQYCAKVSGFVHSRVQNGEDAQDLVQTVFMKVYASLSDFDEGKASLSTWIYTITRNTVYDYWRKKRDRPTLELIDTAQSGEEEAPEDAVLNNEALEELACALKKLPQEQRDIIILLYYKGLERKNAAQMLGMTYGQLRYLHDKAIRRLGGLLRIK